MTAGTNQHIKTQSGPHLILWWLLIIKKILYTGVCPTHPISQINCGSPLPTVTYQFSFTVSVLLASLL